MKVGDTFFFDGVEFSIKEIDTKSTEKFPNGRVNASKFIGSHSDPDNPRTIQRGRPKMFSFSDVAEVLGETFTATEATEVTSDVEMTEEASTAWSKVRDTTISFPDIKSTTSTPTTVFNSSTDW